MKRVRWNIREQARKALKSYNERPEWVKRISYFAGTNTVAPQQQSSKDSANG